MTFYNRESKVMLQGNHKHLMTFMDKHFVRSKSGTNKEEYNDQVAKPKQHNKQNISTKRKKPQKEITYLKLNHISLRLIMITITKYLTKLLKAN